MNHRANRCIWNEQTICLLGRFDTARIGRFGFGTVAWTMMRVTLQYPVMNTVQTLSTLNLRHLLPVVPLLDVCCAGVSSGAFYSTTLLNTASRLSRCSPTSWDEYAYKRHIFLISCRSRKIIWPGVLCHFVRLHCT